MFKYCYNQVSVHKLVDTPSTNSHIRRDLAHSLAEEITKVNMQKEELTDYNVYRMSVIVATKEDFFKAVADYARISGTGYPVSLESLYREELR